MTTGPTKMLRSLSSGLHDRTGNTAVEFALVLLPLMMFITGIVEFGRYLWTQHTLEHACEVASHYVYANSHLSLATLKGAMQTQVQGAVPGLQAAKIGVTTSDSALGTVNFITINVTYPFTFMGLTGLGATAVTAKATFPVE